MSQLINKVRTAAGDLQINYEALANLPANPVNPNLLINGDFQIWQRKEEFTNISNAYCADRWQIKNATTTPTATVKKSVGVPDGQLMTQSMYLKETANANTYLRYNFETPIKGTFTLSFWYKSSMPITSYVYDNGQSVKLMELETSGTWQRAMVYFTATSASYINVIHAMNIGECFIAGVKLEVGKKVTPFVPRNYTEELLACQRYYEKRSVRFIPLGCTTPSTYYIAIDGGHHFVQKRVDPTITMGKFYNNENVEVPVTATTITSSIGGITAITLNTECNQLAMHSQVEFDAEIN